MAGGGGIGGYQYSEDFLARAESEGLGAIDGQWVLSFHHHFPRAAPVHRAGGKIVYYLDATLGAELEGHALEVALPPRAATRALEIERENLATGDQIITMSRWLRDYLVDRKQVSPDRISVVLPGANLELPAGWRPAAFSRPESGPRFTFGLVGNDWERKGLRYLIKVVQELARRGVASQVRVIGRCPRDIDPATTEVVGPIDKRSALPEFIRAVAGCDLGCMFSDKEAFGISVLEFLRLGIPVAGFASEGPADSIPPDAGFRFDLGETPGAVAEALGAYFRSPERQRQKRLAAAAWSGSVTWERALGEVAAILTTGSAPLPVQPWSGQKMSVA